MACNIYQYLFLITGGEVRVYRHKDGILDTCTRCGRYSFDFQSFEDLWDWWEGYSSYVKGDDVDFLFISDAEFDRESLMKSGKAPAIEVWQSSFWTCEVLKGCLPDIIKELESFNFQNSIELKDGNGQSFSIAPPVATEDDATEQLSLFVFPKLTGIPGKVAKRKRYCISDYFRDRQIARNEKNKNSAKED